MRVFAGSFTANVSVPAILLAAMSLWGCGERKEADDKADAKAAETRLEQLGLTAEQAAKPVARVGDREITVGDVTEQINRLSPYVRRRWADPEKRKEFLQKLVRVELLSMEAERLGLEQDPEVQRTVKQVMIRLMIKNDLEQDLLPTSIDEEVLKAEYEKELDKYHRPAQVRASQIVVKSKAEAERLIATIRKSPEDRKLFREQARQVSLDAETRERGGDLGYFSRPEERRDDEPRVPEDVARAAWALKNVGEVSDAPVQTEQGFHVVMLTNRKPEMNRSFDSVKRLIENRMLRDARTKVMDEFVEGLRAKADIRIHEENLAKVRIPEAAPGHQGVPAAAGPDTRPETAIADDREK